jgi:hypothetical protein
MVIGAWLLVGGSLLIASYHLPATLTPCLHASKRQLPEKNEILIAGFYEKGRCDFSFLQDIRAEF